jgi:hypothetical protein
VSSLRTLAVLVLLLAFPAGAQAEPSEDPHGRADRCEACHEAGGPGERAGPSMPSVAACTACHPDRERDMHAVGMTPLQAKVPAEWPTERGVVVCATCHAEPVCEEGRPDQRPWLRGGPYDRPADACWACHLPLEYRQVDPHHPDTARDPGDRSCAACHTNLPEEGAAPGDAGLRADPQTLCAVCHQESMHEGAAAHLGRPLPEGVATTLPVDARGIACWTCHEVHGDGRTVARAPDVDRARALAIVEQIVDAQWLPLLPDVVAWPGRRDVEAHDPLLALPVQDDQLCRSCHGGGVSRSAP